MYYAQLENGLVKNIIIATPDVIAELGGVYVETGESGRFAEIGDGYNGEFLRPPLSTSVWVGDGWSTPPTVGSANQRQIIKSDGIDILPLFVAGNFGNEAQSISINGESVIVEAVNGYAEFEFSTDTEGLITIEWGGLTFEVVAYDF